MKFVGIFRKTKQRKCKNSNFLFGIMYKFHNSYFVFFVFWGIFIIDIFCIFLCFIYFEYFVYLLYFIYFVYFTYYTNTCKNTFYETLTTTFTRTLRAAQRAAPLMRGTQGAPKGFCNVARKQLFVNMFVKVFKMKQCNN